MNYGPNIERARRRAGLTQARLGELIGKDGGTISGYEAGRFRPDIGLLVPIADATGASLDELLRGDGPAPAIRPADGERAVLDVLRALRLAPDEAIRRLCQAPAEAVPSVGESSPPVYAPARKPAGKNA